MKVIDTDRFSAALRARMIDVGERRLLITNYSGTEQEKDLSEPPNCGGYGRIRHFRRRTSLGWPENPLPIDPACRALQLPHVDMIRAQAFQNAACNWRCWYCFVPDALLSADPRFSGWLSPEEMVDLYQNLPEPPPVLDLTGGQPDLTPEWVLWMIQILRDRGLTNTYVWSDDNLSNDYFWSYLTDADREIIVSYRNYGRVGCFKGYDAESFAFNTRADPSLFERQFELMGRLLSLGLDMYAYATFTSAASQSLSESMPRFVDRLQQLDENLPLRTIPLEIQVFTPVRTRAVQGLTTALDQQTRAIEAWQRELEDRFSSSVRVLDISTIPLSSRRVPN